MSDYGRNWSYGLSDEQREARYAQPVYAVCNAGAGRWFWLAEEHHWYWRGESGDHYFPDGRWPELGSGYVADRDAALTLAREAAGPRALQEEPGYANIVHKERAKARNMDRARARNHEATGTAQPEYLYTIGGGWDHDYQYWTEYRAVPHAILRKTDRYVYVADPWERTASLRLDREELERTGEVCHRRRGRWPSDPYYLSPPDVAAMNAEHYRQTRHPRGAWRPEGDVATALDVLGLSADASEIDIERAYRRAALDAHPDRGGDPERFIIVQAAYEVAIAAARVAA